LSRLDCTSAPYGLRSIPPEESRRARCSWRCESLRRVSAGTRTAAGRTQVRGRTSPVSECPLRALRPVEGVCPVSLYLSRRHAGRAKMELRPQDRSRSRADRNPTGSTEFPAGLHLDHRQTPFLRGPQDRVCDPTVRVPRYKHDLRAASRDGLGRLVRSDHPVSSPSQSVQRHDSVSSLRDDCRPPDNLSENRQSRLPCQSRCGRRVDVQ
jgi:hypothetical protein